MRSASSRGEYTLYPPHVMSFSECGTEINPGGKEWYQLHETGLTYRRGGFETKGGGSRTKKKRYQQAPEEPEVVDPQTQVTQVTRVNVGGRTSDRHDPTLTASTRWGRPKKQLLHREQLRKEGYWPKNHEEEEVFLKGNDSLPKEVALKHQTESVWGKKGTVCPEKPTDRSSRCGRDGRNPTILRYSGKCRKKARRFLNKNSLEDTRVVEDNMKLGTQIEGGR